MKTQLFAVSAGIMLLAGTSAIAETPVSDDIVAAQRAALAENTKDMGFGPQSPRDIATVTGTNMRTFEAAPAYTEMNLCNIHFHENAEHKGGEFTTSAGNGDGKGAETGFKYDGTLTEAELAPYGKTIGEGKYGDLVPGDTIELHYVHTTAKVVPGPTLGACLSEAIMNPQLRVEAQVYVLVNDPEAADFNVLAQVEQVNGLYQAVNIPTNTGEPVQYAGSTTGPSYNSAGSPLQVSWSVRPEVMKVNIATVDAWLSDNIFNEDHAHGVRNLVVSEELLSPISN
jgi:hypothetical protein